LHCEKIIVFIVLCIYGFSSIGATVHYHYCMNEFEGWSLLENKDNKCGKCGMKESSKKNGCCKDEQQEFKLKTDHQKASIADFAKVFFASIETPQYQDYKVAKLHVTKLCYSNYHPPPNIHKQNLQVLYCTFLI
jgi:hypothetical protein